MVFFVEFICVALVQSTLTSELPRSCSGNHHHWTFFFLCRWLSSTCCHLVSCFYSSLIALSVTFAPPSNHLSHQTQLKERHPSLFFDDFLPPTDERIPLFLGTREKKTKTARKCALTLQQYRLMQWQEDSGRRVVYRIIEDTLERLLLLTECYIPATKPHVVDHSDRSLLSKISYNWRYYIDLFAIGLS